LIKIVFSQRLKSSVNFQNKSSIVEGLNMSIRDSLSDDKIREFLEEDIGYGDITSFTLIEVDQKAKANLFFREIGIAAGLTEARIVFEILGCEVKTKAIEGECYGPNTILMVIIGSAQAILSGERTALNIVGRMSGIATIVSEAKKIVSNLNPSVRVAATRKTIPGLRQLDKKAVTLGGGDTHRLRLDDCILIKDNHLKLIPSITEAVMKVRNRVSFTKKIEVEVRTFVEAKEAINAGADIVMFDNMSPQEIQTCLQKLDNEGLREGTLFEASGGITNENLSEYAKSGVDIISMGSLTHSVRNLDVKLEIEMT
jgi:nicotinate-nucleotide pyrophosphorylase (carboxylating)